MAKKNKLEKVLKNMEFLVKELQKEWDESGVTKHVVTMTMDEARVLRRRIQEYVSYYGEMLEKDEIMSFKESMEHCKQNYVTLRLGRKLITEYEKAKDSGKTTVSIETDREEYKLYRDMHDGVV